MFRFAGGPICQDADDCIRQVIEAAGLTPDAEPVFDIRNGLMAEANPRWTGGKKEWTCENCGEHLLGVAARLREAVPHLQP